MSKTSTVTSVPCRGCLSSSAKLYNIHEIGLSKSYVHLVGITLDDEHSQLLCSICATLLQKFSALRRRCRETYNLLVAAKFHGKCLDDIDVYTYMGQLPYEKSKVLTYEYIDTFEEKIQGFDLKEEEFLDDDQEIDDRVIDDRVIDDRVIDDRVIDDREIKQEDLDNEQDNVAIAFLIDAEKKDKVVKVKRKNEVLKIKSRKTKIKYLEKDIIDFAKSMDFDVTFLSEYEQYAELEERKKHKPKRSSIKCEFCAKNFTTRDKLNTHYGRDHDPKLRFVCKICKWRFPFLTRLKYHMKVHRELFTCKLCSFKTKRQETTLSHYLSHKGQKHECQFCQKEFGKITSYFSHVRLSHAAELPWCEMCGESFINDRGMKFHKSRAHKNVAVVFCCEGCSSKFSSEDALERHVSLKRCDLVGCVLCGDGFPSAQLLKYHLIQRHGTGMPPVVDCEGCGIKFHNAMALHRHQSACGIAVPCVQCGEHFAEEALMVQHVAERHGGGEGMEFKCEECDKTFSNAYYYRDHFSRVHRDRDGTVRVVRTPGERRRRRAARTGSPPARTWRPAGEDGVVVAGGGRGRSGANRAVCELCGKAFHCIARLETHLQTHSDERPHQCDQCPKAFKSAFLLENHIRVHTGERPFACASCPKAFKTQTALARHKLVHSGVRKHVCQICEKAFQTSTSVKAHIKFVHMKVPAPPRHRPRRGKHDNVQS